MATRQQEAKDFAHYENLDAVRKKANMYIGSTEPQDGIWTLLREIVDNCVDELANRKPKSPVLIIRKRGPATIAEWEVLDNGGGIPIECKPGTKIPILELVTSKLHAGGKFGTTDANSGTRGTHGIGIKAVSALSITAVFETFREKKGYHIRYVEGKMAGKGVIPSGDDAWPRFVQEIKTNGGTATKSGTWVSFAPDPLIFKGGELSPAQVDDEVFKHLTHWAHISAGLNPGIKIVIDWDGQPHVYHSQDGIVGMVNERVAEEQVEALGKMFHLENDHIDFALSFTDYDGFGVHAYTNSLRNVDEGVHVTAAMNALTAVLKSQTTKDREREALIQVNIKEGLVGILNYKLDEPRFSSQTKEKLVDERVAKPCYAMCVEALTDFFAENPTLARKIIVRCLKIGELKAQYAKTKLALRGLTDARRSRMLLPGKLRAAPDAKPNERELYVVEGDSALGSALKARDARFQEVLPLRGKIMNAMRTKNYEAKLLSDKEILNVLMSMGYDPEREEPLDHLRISKFILLNDADDDGYHIQCLFLSFFYRFMPKAFDRGLIYAARTYEYLVRDSKNTLFGDSIEELGTLVANPNSMKNAVHLKGWGEINADDFAVMAFDPMTRVLQKIKKPTEDEAAQFELLMGPDSTRRAELLGLSADAGVEL